MRLLFGGAACGAAAAVSTALLWRRRDAAEGKTLPALQPDVPLMCPLQSKQWVGTDTVLLRFGLPSPDHVLGLPVPGHVMVVDEAFIYRPYSPVTVDTTTKGHFDLLVKHYPGGEISTQLARMRCGDFAALMGDVTS